MKFVRHTHLRSAITDSARRFNGGAPDGHVGAWIQSPTLYRNRTGGEPCERRYRSFCFGARHYYFHDRLADGAGSPKTRTMTLLEKVSARYDKDTSTLYLDNVPALVRGKPTPEYITHLQFKIAAVDAEIRDVESRMDDLRWARDNPAKTRAPRDKVVYELSVGAHYCSQLQQHRACLICELRWYTLEWSNQGPLS